MSVNYLEKISNNIITEDDAVSILQSEDIVILPTETVYGLGGIAYSHHAIKRIFDTKKRPYRNPLIVHYYSIEQIAKDAFLNDNAQKLASAFWPGPVTLVLKKRRDSQVSSLCTANNNTIAVRIPLHPITLSILKKVGVPVAMPSANSYQRVSPTNVSDAIINLRDIPAIEGGYCKYGIESTIIDCTHEYPTILRYGSITQDLILKKVQINIRSVNEQSNMPGNHKKHYSTKKNIRLNATEVNKGEGLIAFGQTNLIADNMINLSKNGNLKEAARKLFYSLQKLDKSSCESICVMKIPNEDIGIAINDRLKKASFRYTPEQSEYFINQKRMRNKKREQRNKENIEYENSNIDV